MEQYNKDGCTRGSSSGLKAGRPKLLPGYRFKPYDRELIVDYLRRKVDNQPLPADCIREVNINFYHPQTLQNLFKPNDGKEMFFFTPRDRKYKNGQRPNRAVIEESRIKGYWKASGKDKKVMDDQEIVGYKKSLVFYSGKSGKNEGKKTDWLMHEYKLPDPPLPCGSGENGMKLDDYVLCKIYHNARNNKTNLDNKIANEEASDEPNQEASDEPNQETSDEPNQDARDKPNQEASGGHGKMYLEVGKINNVGEMSTQVDNINCFLGDYDDFRTQVCYNSIGDDGFEYPPLIAQPVNCMGDSSYEFAVPPSYNELASLPLNCTSNLRYVNDEYTSTNCTTSIVGKDEEALAYIVTQDFPAPLVEPLNEIRNRANEFSELDEIPELDM